MKHTCRAIAPDGTVYTRETDHNYTHAVVVELSDNDSEKSGTIYGRTELSMHTSLKFAEAKKRQAESWGCWKRVLILEVEIL